MVLISSCGVELCHAICRTGCSWTKADASFGGDSSDQIQTTFCREVSTLASRRPSGLNAMVKAPRAGPVDSGLMLKAEELDVSAYSASPAALINLSRQIVALCWSDSNTCESVVAEENYQQKISEHLRRVVEMDSLCGPEEGRYFH